MSSLLRTNHSPARAVGHGFAAPRGSRSALRRRFLAVGFAGMSVLLATMAPSYLGNTGTTTASVTPGVSSTIYPIANGATIPSTVNALEYTPSTDITSGSVTTAVLPGWSPSANSAGSVTTAGDVALVDATGATNGIDVNLYVTNMAGLQSSYSSWALPIEVFSSSCTSGACTWTLNSTIGTDYITSTTGNLMFNLPKGFYYDIVMPTGGSYYCISTSGTLAPSFYFTGQVY